METVNDGVGLRNCLEHTVMIDDPVNSRYVLVTLQESDILSSNTLLLYILNETVIKGSCFITYKVWNIETIQLN